MGDPRTRKTEAPAPLPAGLAAAPASWRRLWAYVRSFTAKGKTCYASQRTLAVAAGLDSPHSDRQVRRILAGLRAARWLDAKRRGKGRTLALWTRLGEPVGGGGRGVTHPGH